MGSVVISVDAELGWGFHDLESPPETRLESGRRGWRTLLEGFEEFDVPATWAVVGHLMLSSCDGEHADHPAPEGWFERERTDWSDREDLRFCPDLVRATLKSPVGHELAGHSFSHVLFGDPDTTRELARAELERSLEIADDWGVCFESFVYPRNDVDHRDVLAETGFSAYRGRSPTASGVREVFETTVSGESRLVEPTVDEYGLVNVPASTFLFGFEGPARTAVETVWEDPMVAVTRRGIDEAATHDGIFHLWVHPNNFVTERDDKRLRAVLAHIDRRREETDLRVETMGEVARRLRSNPTKPSSQTVSEDRYVGMN
ncbi:polysaccharide deacetylase family protein [Natrialbaceae archaeon A-gly3]